MSAYGKIIQSCVHDFDNSKENLHGRLVGFTRLDDFTVGTHILVHGNVFFFSFFVSENSGTEK